MQSRMTKDIVLNALLMAVWRRNPQKQVLVHSDQGSQYTSHEWQSFLKSHGLEGSMSRRGNFLTNLDDAYLQFLLGDEEIFNYSESPIHRLLFKNILLSNN